MTTVPRIHAEFIKAWADGYEIEAFNPERGQWITVPEPGWFDNIEYRVRPGAIEEPAEPQWDRYDVRVDQDLFNDNDLELINDCSDFDHYNLRLLFKDGELYDAKVVERDGADDLPW